MPATLEDLREALTAASGASNLVPKIIDRLLLEYVRKYSPLEYALPRKTWETTNYFFNQRNQLPKAQFTTEAPSTTDVAATSSNYVQNNYPIMHLQSQLDISTFAAKVAIVNGNLFDLELAGAAKSMKWLEGITHFFGAQNATTNTKRPQWNGFDVQIGNANKVNGAGTALTLTHMDNLIDAVKSNVAEELNDNWFFCMSPKMMTRMNGLFIQQQRFNEGMTKIFRRDDFGFPDAPVADNRIDAGFEVATYRNIPIVLASFLSNQGQMGTLTVTDNGASAGSSITNQAYYYVVEAVTEYGLMYASAEGTVTPTAAHSISVAWSTPTPTDAFGNAIRVIGYRIYRSAANAGGSGGETLYALSAATDNNDAAITSFIDTGLIQDPTTNTALFANTVAKSGANAVSDGVTYPRGGSINEDVVLVPRNPEYILVPVVNELQSQMLAPVNARTRQFALTSDLTLAMRAGLFGAKLYNVKTA